MVYKNKNILSSEKKQDIEKDVFRVSFGGKVGIRKTFQIACICIKKCRIYKKLKIVVYL